jgi:hypothetical protein
VTAGARHFAKAFLNVHDVLANSSGVDVVKEMKAPRVVAKGSSSELFTLDKTELGIDMSLLTKSNDVLKRITCSPTSRRNV